MNFQPLARKWRPRRFEDLVGQAHVVRALSYALDRNQLHHALLFSGTRGVGKTTLARIIAKSLNCEHGVSSRPCANDESACTSCREIDAGRFVDLIEVDAASRTGVDDTRALMDNVAYAPTVGRTKVYLIDEVHMLTKHSFNALLKTFEEPPAGVEFVLATTEPEKIPVTILSRCLQFPLKRLPAPQIADQLRHVSQAESLTVDDSALEQIARAADGSMRDGLSLVDQGLAFGGGRLDNDTVHEMLGTVAGDRIQSLVAAIVDADAPTAMAALDGLYADGIDTGYIMDAVATAWQQIATIQLLGAPLDASDAAWQPIAARAEAGAVQVFYDIALAGIRDLAYAPDPLVGTRMAVLRMLAFEPRQNGIETSTGAVQAAVEHEPSQPESSAGASAPERSGSAEVASEPARKAPGTVHNHGSIQEPSDAKDSTPSDSQPFHAAVNVENQSPPGQAPAKLDTDQVENAGAANAPETFPATERITPQASKTPSEPPPTDWHTLLDKLEVTGLCAQLAANLECERLDPERLELVLAESRQFLLTPAAREELERAVATCWGETDAPPTLAIRVASTTADTAAERSRRAADAAYAAASEAIENDPFVNKLRQRLGASVRPESIQPTGDRRANE